MINKKDLLALLDIAYGCTRVTRDADITVLLNQLREMIPFQAAILSSAIMENKKIN